MRDDDVPPAVKRLLEQIEQTMAKRLEQMEANMEKLRLAMKDRGIPVSKD